MAPFIRGLFVIAFSVTTLGALAEEDCSKALIKTEISSSGNEITQLSLAWSLSEGAYKEAKKDASANAIIYGVPVGADYGEFRKNIQTKAESLNIERFQYRAYAYATSGLSDNGLNAYKEGWLRRYCWNYDIAVGNHLDT